MLAQAEGVKVNSRSLAMPGVEPGAIIEYRWQEARDNKLANYARLQVQRDIPVQTVTYHIEPLSSPFFHSACGSCGFSVPIRLC